MRCTNCGAENQKSSSFCEYCGNPLQAEQEQSNYNQRTENQEKSNHMPENNKQSNQGNPQQYNNPANNLNTNYSLLKYILLGIITLGIYDIVVLSSMSTNINIVASRYDGKKTMHYCLLFFIFSWLTLGIGVLVWYHKFSDRIGNELRRRSISYDFGAGTFWLWSVLGILIVVGPFVYVYKLL